MQAKAKAASEGPGAKPLNADQAKKLAALPSLRAHVDALEAAAAAARAAAAAGVALAK